ncbi:MAG TPA: phytanoyl-CoA dioxygenase family protein [Polyangia bacterium]|jgi:hypothetical protein
MTGETPLLDSRQLAVFVADGYLRFDAIVPQALCDGVLRELAAGGPPSAFGAPPDGSARTGAGRPLAGLFHEWPAIASLLELPAVAAIVRSLLGAGARYDHHHAHVVPGQQRWSQPWHADAIQDPRQAAFDIQLFFFPHATPRQMGGTMVLPGSHLRQINEAAIARYQNFLGQTAMDCPAGSLLVAHHGIWHCGQPNLTSHPRTMFKLRLAPSAPQRRTWDTRDLDHPEVGRILSRDHRWYGHEVRLEIANRIRLWRVLTGNRGFDVDQWLTRLENEAPGSVG